MTKFIWVFLLLLIPINGFAQEKVLGPPQVVEQLKTPQSEVEDAVAFLLKIPEYDRQFIRFFTIYDVPQELREQTVLTLSYVCHSLTGLSDKEEAVGFYYPLATQSKDKAYRPIQHVTDTLIFIDLRHYNWTEQAWEKVSEED